MRALAVEERRLIWRCRRGMKELDVLLERFARERYEAASLEERQTFMAFLELPDPEIAAYLLGEGPAADPRIERLSRLITAPRAG